MGRDCVLGAPPVVMPGSGGIPEMLPFNLFDQHLFQYSVLFPLGQQRRKKAFLLPSHVQCPGACELSLLTPKEGIYGQLISQKLLLLVR